ncbi:MAG TPA: aminotransferase class V-fold PLP-dependent enzyme [Vicinamibacterales bacterium]|nr:aminotransferase class V-fold PLP-dependent enzyme [Vicinamibacterales bacterium]
MKAGEGFGRHRLVDWPLDPSVTYLNHGTVGVAPRRVLAAQQAIRDEMERQPSGFLLREVSGLVGVPTGRPSRLRTAAADVASFVSARGDDLVFVDNATTGVNAVMRSLPLAAGDEVLITDHNYGATARVAAFAARETQAQVRTVRVPYPAFDPRALVDAVAAAITPRTRIAVLDHITSESALIFPLAELAAVCRAGGVLVLVDGAHAPGVLPLDIPALGVDWYTANLHKWACSPRSCGFLWAHPSRQPDLHPPVISWGLDLGFTAEFDWVGTRDPSPWLAAPEGLAFLRDLGWDDVRRHNHDLVWRAARTVTDRWGTTLEIDEASVGFMATVPLPSALGRTSEDAARLRDALLFEDHIEIQVHAGHDRLWARISVQVYNEWEDIERLAEAVLRRASRSSVAS